MQTNISIEDAELAITYLTDMQNNYVEGYGYEAHPLPEYYAIETALKTLSFTIESMKNNKYAISLDKIDELRDDVALIKEEHRSTECVLGCASSVANEVLELIDKLIAEGKKNEGTN